MSGNNKDQEEQIANLDSFIQVTYARLSTVLSRVGWSFETVSNESETTVRCPFHKGHLLQEQSLEDHLEKCQWKAEGYTDHDLPLSEPGQITNSSSTIKFDEHLQEMVLLRAQEVNPTMSSELCHCCPWNTLNISPAAGVTGRLIPRTSDRLMANFTGDERKAIYDYVIANTIKPDIGDDIADMNKLTQKQGDQPKTSLLELLAQERNLKRRRAKHRGVHTNKKSQVEILREVITQQMEMYEEYLADSKIKQESKSPNTSETNMSKFHSNVDKKKYVQNTTIAQCVVDSRRSSFSRSDNHLFGRSTDAQTLWPSGKSLSNDVIDRMKRRHRSKSRDSERKKHHSKHKRRHSKEKSQHKDGRDRYSRTEERSCTRHKEYQVENKSDRRKRDRLRDRSRNGVARFDDNYQTDESRLKSNKDLKRYR